MDLDLDNSIEYRDILVEKELLTKYYSEYLQKYITRISKLDELDEFTLENLYHKHNAPNHIMYKLVRDDGSTILKREDGTVGYEFLIEFDKKSAEYGIYYGCKALIFDKNQKKGIEVAEKDWEMMYAEISNVLNDTFVSKDFSKRFLKTNNANNRTFWPFWISLGEDEDVIKVAARAVKLIGKCYELFLPKICDNTYHSKSLKQKEIKTNTRYTQEKYEEILMELEHGRKYSGRGKPKFKKPETMTGHERRIMFEKFLHEAEAKKIIAQDLRYEKCWKLVNISPVNFAYLYAALCDKLGYVNTAWDNAEYLFKTSEDNRFENGRQIFSSGKQNGFGTIKDAPNMLNELLDIT